jgi:hypothetical protein
MILASIKSTLVFIWKLYQTHNGVAQFGFMTASLPEDNRHEP